MKLAGEHLLILIGPTVELVVGEAEKYLTQLVVVEIVGEVHVGTLSEAHRGTQNHSSTAALEN